MPEEIIPLTEFDLGADDDKDVPGGFSDPSDLPPEPPEQAEAIETPPEKKEGEPGPEEDDKDKKPPGDLDEKPPGDLEKKAEEEPEPGPEDSFKKFNDQILRQQTQISELMYTVRGLQGELRESQKSKIDVAPKEPDIPAKIDTDAINALWEDNPTEAVRLIAENEAGKTQTKINETMETQRLEQANSRALETQQDKSYEIAAGLAPEIGQEGSDLRNQMTKIYFDKENGLSERPDGPFLATCAAMYLTGYVPAHMRKEAENKGEKTGAELERSRQERVNQGIMHGGRKDTTKKAIELTPEDKQWITRMGITEESYRQAKDQLNLK